MKTPIILTLLAFPILIFGQVINHFDKIDATWHVARTKQNSSNSPNPNFVATTTTVYSYIGDTLINNEKWMKLYSTNDSLFKSNLIYRGLLRTQNNIVLKKSQNHNDTLYNFNLTLGDSVLYNLHFMLKVWLKIIKVDSILINGDYHKRLKFAEANIGSRSLNEVWIEGIGSIHGPLFPAVPETFFVGIPDSLMLTCTSVNNQKYWQNPFYNSCYVNIVLGLKNMKKTKLSIYPNPFATDFQIKFAKADNYHISIFNATGQKIIEKSSSANILNVDLSVLNDGIYFLTVDNKKERWTSKLIKKN